MDSKISSICKCEFCDIGNLADSMTFSELSLLNDKSNCIRINSTSVEFTQKRSAPGEMVDTGIKIKITDITTSLKSVEDVEGVVLLTYTNGTVKIVGGVTHPIVLNSETSGTPEVTYLHYKGLQPKYASVYHP